MITREHLTGDQVSDYRRDGYVLVREVLDADGVDTLRAAHDGMQANTLDEGTLAFDLCKRDERTKDFELDFRAFLWKSLPEFRAVAFSPRLAEMAATLLDTDRVALLGDSIFTKPPHRGGRLHWHQDAMAWPLDRPGGLSVWIALDDASPENGSMVFAPGSHRLGQRLPVDSPTGDVLYTTYVGGDRAGGKQGHDLKGSGMLPITSPAAEGLSEVETHYQAGDCSFHDSLIWHASGFNTSSSIRRAYGIRYVDGHRLWLGEEKAFYYFTDDEVGVEIGAPIGGPNFPIVWPATEASAV